MNKPKGYDETYSYSYTETKTLPPGGYICKVMGVKESKSKSGKDMLEISLDINDGEFKGFYADKYKADTRKEKKWGCVVYQLIEDEEGNCNRGLKTFLTSIEESNSGFSVVWGDKFCESLKGKRIIPNWFPQWLSSKESTCKTGDLRHRFSLWVRKIPRRRKWQPIPVFLPGKSHEQTSLTSYSP